MAAVPKSGVVRRIPQFEAATSAELKRDYAVIGKALSCCEAASFCVGFPWLPPVPRVRKLFREVDRPIEDFLRLSLLGIATDVLELYCDDLEAPHDKKQQERELYLEKYSTAEQFAVVIVLGSLILIGAAVSLRLVKWSPLWGLLGFLCSTSLLALVMILYSDKYRRASLCWLLSAEIRRRQGGKGTTIPEPLHVCAEIVTSGSKGVH